MSAKGTTSISDGFEAARRLFADEGRVGATKVVLLVSDGEQTVDAAPGKTLLETAVDAAALVKGDDVTVHAWGFGGRVSRATLEQIATDPSKVILAQDIAELTSYLVLLQAAACNHSPPSPSSPPPSPLSPPGMFTTKASLQTALQAFNANPTAATVTYGPIADWDVSAITDMSSLFKDLKNFNADISGWDTSSVTTMLYMFQYASAFNQPLSFDTSSVTTMFRMFQYASAFNQPLSVDTSSVTDMDFMFAYASAFNQPLSFDTSSVTDMGYMFGRASAFNQPLSFDTSSVTGMIQMFFYATAFNQPLSFDTSSVTTMGAMFFAATAFNQPLSFDTSRVTDMSFMFTLANSLSAANKLLMRCTPRNCA